MEQQEKIVTHKLGWCPQEERPRVADGNSHRCVRCQAPIAPLPGNVDAAKALEAEVEAGHADIGQEYVVLRDDHDGTVVQLADKADNVDAPVDQAGNDKPAAQQEDAPSEASADGNAQSEDASASDEEATEETEETE